MKPYLYIIFLLQSYGSLVIPENILTRSVSRDKKYIPRDTYKKAREHQNLVWHKARSRLKRIR